MYIGNYMRKINLLPKSQLSSPLWIPYSPPTTFLCTSLAQAVRPYSLPSTCRTSLYSPLVYFLLPRPQLFFSFAYSITPFVLSSIFPFNYVTYFYLLASPLLARRVSPILIYLFLQLPDWFSLNSHVSRSQLSPPSGINNDPRGLSAV